MFGTEYGILYLLLNFLVMVIGIIAHFLKKKIKGETIDDIKNYFRSHFRNTVISIIGAIFGFVLLVTTASLGIIASFTVGYAADSMLNKAEGNAKITGTGNGK